MSKCEGCGRTLADGAPSCAFCGRAAGAQPGRSAARFAPADEPTIGLESVRMAGRESAPIEPGTVIASRYRILAFAGRGGAGDVYQAQDLKLAQPVALKFLSGSFAGDGTRLARFYQEVRTARAISHPNVCRVHDVQDAGGRSFISMEWIDGEDLATYLKRKGRPPYEIALGLARQIAAGLAAAHDAGIVHRDLKPANILLDARGVARITDFGLAELLTDAPKVRAFEGTPSYMSPEQIAGEEISTRSDVYSLGLVLYETLTGRPAFPARSLEEMLRLRESPPPRPSTIAPEAGRALERIILRCLSNDAARRPPTAREVVEALPGGAKLTAASGEAQARADRIAAFHEELTELRRAGVVHFAEEQLDAMERFHERVRRELVERFDIDVSERGKQLSLGMRAVSLIGAVALSASVFFLCHRIWGLIATPLQVAVLAAAPLAALVATGWIAARDRSRYFTSMAAMFALACFVVDLSLLGQSFNQPPPPWILGAWGAVALILAYAYRLGLVHAIGAIALVACGGALVASGQHQFWPNLLEAPECLLAPGAAMTAVGLFLTRRPSAPFVPIFRTVGLVFVLGPMFLLATWSWLSLLPADPHTVSLYYQIALAAACAAAVVLGIRRRMRETAYCGVLFGVALLYAKFASLCWSWMPKYLFFLVVAAAAVGMLWVLRRLRSSLGPAPQGASS